MASWSRLGVLALFALVAVTGVLLGATSQHEEILHTDVREQDRVDARDGAGNFIPLTGLLVALGTAMAFAWMSRLPPWRRIPPALALFAGVYILVQMVQTALSSYVIVEGQVTMALTLYASNAPAAPSLLVPILAVVLLGLQATLLGARRLLGGAPSEPAHRLLAAAAAATPFLVVLVWGPVRILVALPAGSPDTAGHIVLLLLTTTAAAGVLATTAVLARFYAMARRDPHLTVYALEGGQVAWRIQVALAGLFAVVAVAGAFLEPLDLDVLFSGLTFGATLRAHHVLLMSMAVPLVPLLVAGRRCLTELGGPSPPPPATDRTPGPWDSVAMVLGGVVPAGLLLLPGLPDGALMVWLAAALGPAWVALRLPATAGAAPLLFAAYVPWAIGNTVTAGFVQATDVTIRYGTPPGVLALWQGAALLAAGAAVTRVALTARRGAVRRASAIPMAVGLSSLLAFGALMELPLLAWTLQRAASEAVGIGSLPTSQDLPVQVIMHAVAALCIAGAFLLTARLVRPEWFRGGGRPATTDAAIPASA